jgi:hypothetical protein
MSWPDDADGDVMRRLDESGFDFSGPHEIDFNVDFFDWPPSQDALDRLRPFGTPELVSPDENGPGYVLIQVQAKLTYELVTSMQRRVSNAMAPYGGICESWGVLQSP